MRRPQGPGVEVALVRPAASLDYAKTQARLARVDHDRRGVGQGRHGAVVLVHADLWKLVPDLAGVGVDGADGEGQRGEELLAAHSPAAPRRSRTGELGVPDRG